VCPETVTCTRFGREVIFVLTDGLELNAEEREVWARFQARASQTLKQHGIANGPLMHGDVNQLVAAKYRAASHVPCPLIGPGRYL